LNLFFESPFGLSVSDQETLNRWERLRDDSDGVNECVETMPWEESTDKRDVGALSGETEFCSDFFLRLWKEVIRINPVSDDRASGCIHWF